MEIRSKLKEIIVSSHFIKDLKDEKEINSIIQDILNCSNLGFKELHKFEEHVNGNLIF